ncbi:Protein transport protein Sec24C [Dictyocoela muelleri]|nr:Protein transport protein Sec24C [Dictyocoela muelleri]
MSSNEIKVPSLPKELELNQNMFITFNTDQLPVPLSTTNVFVTENRNSSPYAIRSSMYVIPNENSMLESIYLPLGIVLTPFDLRVSPVELSKYKKDFSDNKGYNNEFSDNNHYKNDLNNHYKNDLNNHYKNDLNNHYKNDLNNIDLNNKHLNNKVLNNILRCSECRSFANPWCKVENNYFICNLCNFKNSFQNCKIDLKSLEIFKHPTIEFKDYHDNIDKTSMNENMIASDFYNSVLKNNCAILIFAIEFTGKSVNSGLFNLSIKAIKENIQNMKYFYKRASLILYNDTIKAIHLRRGDIVIDNYFSDDVIVGDFIAFEIDKFDFILERLEQMISKNLIRPNSNDVGIEFVLRYALSISKYFVGAKTILFTQQKRKLKFTNQNSDISDFSNFESVAGRYIEAKNSFFVFEIRNEIENPIEFLVNKTNGNIYDISQINHKLPLIFQRRVAFGVEVELKTSDSIRKSRIYGNTNRDTFTPNFSQMDDQSSVAYTFFIDEFMRENQNIFIQAIVTYLTHEGEKKVLIFNQRLTASSKFSNVYEFMAVDTIFSLIFKSIVSKSDHTFKSFNKSMADWNKKIMLSLKTYRNKCSADSKPTQLVMPESLKSLPNLFQALIKNKYLNNMSYLDTSSVINNLFYLQRISNKPVDKNLYFVYPRLLTFSDFFIDQNTLKCLQLTKKGLIDGEIYILDNGITIFIFLTKGVDEELIDLLFDCPKNIEKYNSNNSSKFGNSLGVKNFLENLIFTEKDNEENRVLNLLIEKINDTHRDILDVKVVQQGSDIDVMSYFVEDELNGIKAYSEFLCDIHFEIRGVK